MAQRIIRSFGYAIAGIIYVFKTQPNFKFHTVALILVAIAGWHYTLSAGEWRWIVLASGFVFAAELLNTSIETLVNLVSPGYHEKAKIAKDTAAAAVLVAAVSAAIVGLIIFIPKIIA